MCSKRDVVIFLSGAMFFHTMSHICLMYMFHLPLKIASISFTTTMNSVTIIVSGVITIGLLWWAALLPNK